MVYTHKGLKIVVIKRDEPFIVAMLDKLVIFYEVYFKKAILRGFLHRDYYSWDFQRHRRLPDHQLAQQGDLCLVVVMQQ